MRYIIILLLTLSMTASAAEITVNLDRCVVLNSSNDLTAPTRAAVHFTLPAEMTNREIMYAEMYLPLSFRYSGRDSLLEFRLYPMLSDWNAGNINYDNSLAITDSLSAGNYTVKIANNNEFHMDITPFVREVIEGQRSNFGLMAVPEILGNYHLRLPENLSGPIMSNVRIRFVYK